MAYSIGYVLCPSAFNKQIVSYIDFENINELGGSLGVCGFNTGKFIGLGSQVHTIVYDGQRDNLVNRSRSSYSLPLMLKIEKRYQMRKEACLWSKVTKEIDITVQLL
ncbi:hypothetical protein LXL04_022519 [Taraxacum kok-saghyz]